MNISKIVIRNTKFSKFSDKNLPLNFIIIPKTGQLWCTKVFDFWGLHSNIGSRYQNILWIYSISCKMILNFTCHYVKFYNLLYDNGHEHAEIPLIRKYCCGVMLNAQMLSCKGPENNEFFSRCLLITSSQRKILIYIFIQWIFSEIFLDFSIFSRVISKLYPTRKLLGTSLFTLYEV